MFNSPLKKTRFSIWSTARLNYGLYSKDTQSDFLKAESKRISEDIQGKMETRRKRGLLCDHSFQWLFLPFLITNFNE